MSLKKFQESFKKFFKVAVATKMRRPALYAFVIRKLIVSENKVLNVSGF